MTMSAGSLEDRLRYYCEILEDVAEKQHIAC